VKQLNKEPEKLETHAFRSKIIVAVLILIAVVVILAVLVGDLLEDLLLEGGFPAVPWLTGFFSYVADGTLSLISASGYAGVFLLMLLESTSLPVPSEVILPFSGFLASEGLMNLWFLITISTVAGILGSVVDYYIGFALGLEGVKRLKYLPVKREHLESAVIWFNKYGALAVFGSRLIPGFRTLVSFPAGILRMRMAKFLALTGLGCLFWDTILVFAGFYAGIHWQTTISVLRYLSIVAIIAIPAAFVAWYVVNKHRRKRQQLNGTTTSMARTESSKFLS
jgi:membrane protein DedA with SNARE-associated domain